MNKHKKSKLKEQTLARLKVIAIFAALDIAFAALCVFLPQTVRIRTAEEMEVHSGKIENPQINRGGHGSFVRFTMNGEQYVIWWHAGDRYARGVMRELEESGEDVEVTVVLPHDTGSSYKAVDIRNGSKVYYDIAHEIDWLKEQQIAVTALLWIIGILLTAIQIAVLVCWIMAAVRKKRRKKLPTVPGK